jgi:hypothetical protein
MKSAQEIAYWVLVVCPFALASTYGPTPWIDQPLVPSSAAPGASGFTLSVNGANFIPESVVKWDGAPLPTKFLSRSQLTAEVAAQFITSAHSASVTVENPAPGGASNAVFFPVRRSSSTVKMQSRELKPAAMEVVAGDFNNDGRLDLALIGGSQVPGVTILLGNGDGTFSDPLTYPTKVQPTSIVTGDFNADGNLDLALSTASTETTSILLGNGDGTFRLSQTISTAGTLAPGDFNGDGHLDLVFNGDGLQMALGNGDGTFKNPVQLSPNCCNSYASVVVGDFNGDGILDVASNVDRGSYGYTLVFLGRGDGTFGARLESLSAFGSETAVAADFNGDGKLDLVSDQFFGFNFVVVLLGNGDGTLSNRALYPVPGGSFGLAVGDFNADGKIDIAVASNSGPDTSVSLLLGNGDGTFQPFIPFHVTGQARGLAVGDFMGNGSLDLVVGTGQGLELFLQSTD